LTSSAGDSGARAFSFPLLGGAAALFVSKHRFALLNRRHDRFCLDFFVVTIFFFTTTTTFFFHRPGREKTVPFALEAVLELSALPA
jgi:hypothetical protein